MLCYDIDICVLTGRIVFESQITSIALILYYELATRKLPKKHKKSWPTTDLPL